MRRGSRSLILLRPIPTLHIYRDCGRRKARAVFLSRAVEEQLPQNKEMDTE